jgi:Asp/Glu/hydantoin racemase
MKKNLTGKTVGIIHAALISSKSVQKFIDEILPEVTIVHLVDDTIQNTNFACEPGVIPKQNYFKFAQYAHNLEVQGVDLIILACSTFNRAVEHARPMMDLAVQHGNKIGLIATVPTTIPASERLLKLAASEAGKEIEVTTILCTEAFKAILAGDIEKHNEILVKEIEKLSETVSAIVLAQVSMSALEPHLKNTKVPVYNSGRTGFDKAREILESL